jgi:Dolichyl-phosphate-mannose-protein mannosyltransferase
MATAEEPQLGRGVGDGSSDDPAEHAGVDRARGWAWAGLALVLLGGLGLRLWGARQGLPYAYNSDEADHFLAHAVVMFEHGTLNPGYFSNPPAFTYLLHALLAVAYGGAGGAVDAYRHDPSGVFTLARVAAALLGTAALWLLYAMGTRLFNRAAGLLAAAIEAVAFLPVFYAHLALNDVPTLAPVTLSLLGSAGVLRKGRARDYLIAGVGLGLASATKYTGGIVIVPLVGAVAARYIHDAPAAGRRVVRGLGLAAFAALAAFLIANPYALLDYSAFHRELVHQSTLSAEAQGKLGAPRNGGIVYYLWSLTWGLGWVPALAALGGAVTVWRSDRALWWLLVPAALAFLAFMGLQGRYFGRWLLPIFPIMCLLAAGFAVQTARAGAGLLGRWQLRRDPAARRRDGGGVAALRVGLAALLVAALLGQGLIYSVHSGLVLASADTRTLTRNWMLTHIAAGSRVVVEPVSPNVWGQRWKKYPSRFDRLAPRRAADGRLEPRYTHEVSLEDYERTLRPALIGYYEEEGYCWVISGSTESGRAFADPSAVPQAIAYYRALSEQGEVLYRASPYAHDQGPVAFNFDWSFDYYPLAYSRPGPLMTVYRLHGGRCGAA